MFSCSMFFLSFTQGVIEASRRERLLKDGQQLDDSLTDLADQCLSLVELSCLCPAPTAPDLKTRA